MKKHILVILSVLICTMSMAVVDAKSTTSPALASAIKMYKTKNYSGCYIALNDIVKKDPSNALAYYYLAMSSAQIGKKDEAIDNYTKVMSLSPNGVLGKYAAKGKVCLENPDKCHEPEEVADPDDAFIRGGFGSGFSEKVRSDYEKQDTIEDILGIIIPETRDMFACEMIATKAVSIAKERIQALEHMGFCLSEEALIGHDGTKYNSYYVREV